MRSMVRGRRKNSISWWWQPPAVALAALSLVAVAAAAAPGRRLSSLRTRERSSQARQPAPRKLARAIDYNRDIRPILSKNCFACHGPDEGHRVMNLHLGVRAVATAPRPARPPAIIPGDPAKSLV